jgi:hypothetical protein
VFNGPYGIAIDTSGILYVTDMNPAIRMISTAGIFTSRSSLHQSYHFHLHRASHYLGWRN